MTRPKSQADWQAEIDRLEADNTRLRDALSAFDLHDYDSDTLLTYEHKDGEVCIVATVTCGPVLETLEALLDGTTGEPTGDTPNPKWDDGGRMSRRPLLEDDVPDQPNFTPKQRRKKCPITCQCLCHDMNGGPSHHGQPCPEKLLDVTGQPEPCPTCGRHQYTEGKRSQCCTFPGCTDVYDLDQTHSIHGRCPDCTGAGT